ncbi:MAG TPA: hypothetical protein VKZ95_00890 [Sphingobacteriaceae bacterium]|nr:hypothetical protein [Sphingobacteriaceae bacterium]
MAGIKIIPEASKPFVPKNKDLSSTRPRFTAPGGKPPLQLQVSYNRQGTDGTNYGKSKGKK